MADIYAAGDCALVKNRLTGKAQYSPMGSSANLEGRTLAQNLNGENKTYPGVLGTGVVKLPGLNVGRTGLTESAAKEAGYDVETVVAVTDDKAHYYPGAAFFITKLLADRNTHQLLGVQVLGPGAVDKMVDIAVVGLSMGLKLEDFENLDLAYAPPYSSAKDPVNMAGFMIENLSHGLVEQFFPEDVDALPRDGSVTLLDVRTPGEYADGHAEGFVNLPVDDLRERLREVPVGKPVYVICQSGLRSYIACRILAQQGFKCYNLSGGWRFYANVVGQLYGADAPTHLCGVPIVED